MFLKIAKSSVLRYPVGRGFDKIALSRMVKETEANLCFSIFGKNLKITLVHCLDNLWVKNFNEITISHG